ncbi:MAG: FAD-dependent oxidoreductase, partial [Comamonadaceae bacterium]|nr:FAD-dependent oxidoreductase [Comamonadaceae bacterium]
QGASGLPVGLFAPHISPDDAPLSRLSRAGLRSTRRLAARLLRHGLDWQDSGVLEHRIGKRLGLPAHGAPTAPSAPEQPPADQPAAPQMASQASRPAQPSQRLAAGLDRAEPNTAQPPQQGQHPAVWHAEAGWLRPAALVQRLLQHPQITLRTRCRVQGIAPVTPSNTEQPSSAPAPQRWQVLVQADAAGSDQALEADCLVIAAAFDSQALAQPWADARLPLNPVRGQIAWGIAAPDPAGPAWPAMPVNGKGSFVHIPLPSDFSPPGQRAIQHGHAIGAAQPLRLWVSGATFEREAPLAAPSAEAVAAAWQQNRQRLSLLMPAAGPALAQHLFQHSAQGPQHWGAVRCTTPDRTPCYGPIGPQAANVLLATGLGARGLTLATLCAEIVCALLHDEPLPVARQLAALVLSSRLPVAATTATPR